MERRGFNLNFSFQIHRDEESEFDAVPAVPHAFLHHIRDCSARAQYDVLLQSQGQFHLCHGDHQARVPIDVWLRSVHKREAHLLRGLHLQWPHGDARHGLLDHRGM